LEEYFVKFDQKCERFDKSLEKSAEKIIYLALWKIKSKRYNMHAWDLVCPSIWGP